MKHYIVLSALACVTALAPATDESSPDDPFRLRNAFLMTQRAEALGVLGLTGEATEEDVERAELRPHLVVPSLAELGALHAHLQQSAKAHP